MTATAKRSQVAGIDLITVTRPGVKNTVLMMHGFGANYEDLAPLEAYLDPEGHYNWIFPNGILQVPLGPHVTGQAWFPIRMADLEAAVMRGEAYDFADLLPDGMKHAEARLSDLVDQLRIDPQQLVIGGFSQGAMMAVQLGCSLKENPKGLLLFSGTLVNQKEWKELLPRRQKTPFFVSHGRRDPVLAFVNAERLHKTLLHHGLAGEFYPFDGHHEIPLPVVKSASAFLRKIS